MLSAWLDSGATLAGKALLLNVSVMVLSEELVFESVDLLKMVTLINWGEHHYSFKESEENIEVEEE